MSGNQHPGLQKFAVKEAMHPAPPRKAKGMEAASALAHQPAL
ncbi:hypothetical protein [Alteribacter salitolerans]|nr:hypothetical protein [Alteribacter salitolerans]